MWSYMALEEGELDVDPHSYRTAKGTEYPVIHVDTEATLMSDKNGHAIHENEMFDTIENHNDDEYEHSLFFFKNEKWDISRNWFVAHNIHKMEPFYVVTVKFVNIAKLFVSGTTHGEVKLWENQSLNCLGVLNAVDWDPRDILQHISHVNKLEKLK